MTLPSLPADADNSLLMEPRETLERCVSTIVTSIQGDPANGEMVLEGIHGKAMEIDAVIELRVAQRG